MKTALLISVLLASFATTATAGKYVWTSGWGQGVTEYLVDDGNKNELNISCPDESGAISGYATINGNLYSSDDGGFNVIVDGEAYNNPFKTDCNVCAANFPFFWSALRKANNIKIEAGGKTVVLPTKNVGKVLPSLKSKNNTCRIAE